MKFKYTHCLSYFIIVILIGCNNCEKLQLTQSDKNWVNHFVPNQSFYYQNAKGQIDTIMVIDTAHQYTLCNRLELSEYQYEIYSVDFKFISISRYNQIEPSITVTTEEWKKNNPYIYFGNLIPYQNDLKNKVPTAIDTVLRDIKFKSVLCYVAGLNAEQNGEIEYFKNFFWNKQLGLMAYTTMDDEVFLRVGR